MHSALLIQQGSNVDMFDKTMLQTFLQGHAPGGTGQEIQLWIPGKGSGPQALSAQGHHWKHEGQLSFLLCLDFSMYRICLVGQVVKVTALGAEDPEFESQFGGGDFSGLSYTSDIKIGTPVVTLPGIWHYRVHAGTGLPSVSILWPGEVQSLICYSYLGVAVHTIVWADPSLRYSDMLQGH